MSYTLSCSFMVCFFSSILLLIVYLFGLSADRSAGMEGFQDVDASLASNQWQGGFQIAVSFSMFQPSFAIGFACEEEDFILPLVW